MALIAAVLLAGAACSEEVELLNACPRVSHASLAGDADGLLCVGVWIQDLEEDPVDLEVETGEGAPVEEAYGHGLVGLTSSSDPPGASHEVCFAKSDVEGAAKLVLRPVDVGGCEGDPVSLSLPAAVLP